MMFHKSQGEQKFYIIAILIALRRLLLVEFVSSF